MGTAPCMAGSRSNKYERVSGFIASAPRPFGRNVGDKGNDGELQFTCCEKANGPDGLGRLSAVNNSQQMAREEKQLSSFFSVYDPNTAMTVGVFIRSNRAAKQGYQCVALSVERLGT